MRAKVWRYGGEAAWYFIAIPKKQSVEIKAQFGAQHRGWGSLPVDVSIGATAWKTSIFYDKRSAAYLLPLKSEVRKKEGIADEHVVNFSLRIRI